jgi:hypothetical protein
MKAIAIVLAAIVGLIGAAAYRTLPEMQRYLKIRSM